MHPIAFSRPVDVAWRNLRKRDKRHAAVAKIGEADSVPGALMRRLLTGDKVANIMGRRGNHGFNHITRLWNADRNGRRLKRWDRDTDADGENILVGRISLVLVDRDEAPWIGEAVDPLSAFVSEAVHPAERRKKHRIFRRKLVGLLNAAVFVDLRDFDCVGADALHFCVRDPFDVAIAHDRFEHPFRVADAAECQDGRYRARR